VDPIKGVGQKAGTFWTRVHEKFLILSQKHFSDHDLEMPFRTKESIEQRWKKKISMSVQLWNEFYKQLKSINKSGWNEDKYIEEAGNLYLSEVGEAFTYAKSVPVLHKLPKSVPMVGNMGTMSATADSPGDSFLPDDDASSSAHHNKKTAKKVNNNAPAQGSGLSRPIGMKKAKKLEKLEGSSTRALIQTSSASFGFENPFLVHMSAVTEDLVTAFKDNTRMKRKDLHAKRQNQQMRMAEMFMSCGEKEKALAILSKIQEDNDLLSLARNADIPSAIEVECHIRLVNKQHGGQRQCQ
jgi:hypothetical protein